MTTTPGPGRDRQDVELGGGQGDRRAPTVTVRRAGSTTRAPVAEAPPLRGRRRSGLDPSDELARAEGLDQVVVRADGEPDDPIDLIGASGEHQDIGVGEGPDLAQDLEAVDAREHDVQDDDVRALCSDVLDGGGAVLRG